MATRRQTTFTAARNTLEMSSPCSDGNIRHRRMTKVMALDMMHALDEELHPWGEPGVVPTEVGKYWLDDPADEDEPWAVIVLAYTHNDRQYVTVHCDDRVLLDWRGKRYFFDDPTDEFAALSFRRRWTPEGPVTP